MISFANYDVTGFDSNYGNILSLGRIWNTFYVFNKIIYCNKCSELVVVVSVVTF